MRSTKFIKNCSSSLCTCLHHMVILRTRNKITDFLMILAWASPFNRSIKLIIISHTIKFGSRKLRINVFLERSNRGHQIFFGVLSIMPCATAVNDFLGVLCATFGVSCSTKCSTMWTRFFFPYCLVFIFNVMTISCPMLRPLSCLTMFCAHNFSLMCRFNLQFLQNYINIDTDEIQH